MAENEKTSKGVASTAAKLLRDPKSSKEVKQVAASALTQAPDKKIPIKKKVEKDEEVKKILAEKDAIIASLEEDKVRLLSVIDGFNRKKGWCVISLFKKLFRTAKKK